MRLGRTLAVSVSALLLASACGPSRPQRGALELSPRTDDPVPPSAPLPPLGPGGATLSARWAYSGGTITSALALDEAGNLFWAERDSNGGLELVSATPDGAIRFRALLADAHPAGLINLLTTGQQHVVATWSAPGTCPTDTHVEARAAGDGTLAWNRTLGADGSAPGAECTVGAGRPAADGVAIVLVTRRCAAPEVSCAGALDAFAVDGGALLWSVPADVSGERGVPPPLPGPIVDEDGNVYVALARGIAGDPSEILSVTRRGAERYRRAGSPIRALQATASGAIVGKAATGDALLDASTGDAVVPLRFGLEGPVLAGTALFGVAGAHLVRASLSTGIGVWEFAVMPDPPSGPTPGSCARASRFGPILTQQGTLLLVEQLVYSYCLFANPAVLREVDVAGKGASQVELADAQGVIDVALGDGRLYVLSGSLYSGPYAILAYDAPGRRPAPHGWIATGGSMSREWRAR